MDVDVVMVVVAVVVAFGGEKGQDADQGCSIVKSGFSHSEVVAEVLVDVVLVRATDDAALQDERIRIRDKVEAAVALAARDGAANGRAPVVHLLWVMRAEPNHVTQAAAVLTQNVVHLLLGRSRHLCRRHRARAPLRRRFRCRVVVRCHREQKRCTCYVLHVVPLLRPKHPIWHQSNALIVNLVSLNEQCRESHF